MAMVDVAWQAALAVDEAGDNDVSFVVPAGEEWQVLWVWAEYTSDATVGNRQLVVEAQDSGSDVIGWLAQARATQAASLTRYYLCAPGVADDTSFGGNGSDYLQTNMPTAVLSAGETLRVYDAAGVSGSDSSVFQVRYMRRVVG